MFIERGAAGVHVEDQVFFQGINHVFMSVIGTRDQKMWTYGW